MQERERESEKERWRERRGERKREREEREKERERERAIEKQVVPFCNLPAGWQHPLCIGTLLKIKK